MGIIQVSNRVRVEDGWAREYFPDGPINHKAPRVWYVYKWDTKKGRWMPEDVHDRREAAIQAAKKLNRRGLYGLFA